MHIPITLETLMGRRSDMNKIIVGVDGSEASLEALRRAKDLARTLNAQVEVIGCWDYPRMYDGYMISGIEGFKESADKVLNDAVKRVFGSDAPSNLKVSLLRGDPRALLTKASENADLLVVGRRGHGSFTGMLIGSVSSSCIAHAKCPVLVAHAPEENGN